MFKKSFQIAFEPSYQPGHQTRNVSLTKFLGGAQPSMKKTKCPNIIGETNLRNKFGSNQVPELLPSRTMRKLGTL